MHVWKWLSRLPLLVCAFCREAPPQHVLDTQPSPAPRDAGSFQAARAQAQAVFWAAPSLVDVRAPALGAAVAAARGAALQALAAGRVGARAAFDRAAASLQAAAGRVDSQLSGLVTASQRGARGGGAVGPGSIGLAAAASRARRSVGTFMQDLLPLFAPQ
jgi:hypothetical protein